MSDLTLSPRMPWISSTYSQGSVATAVPTLPLGSPFQTDQLSSSRPCHHKTLFPSKGCLRTFAHSVLAALG